MGGSTSQTTSSTQSNNQTLNDTLTNLIQGVNDQWNQGSDYFDQSLWGGVSDTTQNAWNTLNAAANNGAYGNLVNSAFANNQQWANQGGFNSNMLDSINSTNDATSGYAWLKNIGGALPGMYQAQNTVGNLGQQYAGLADAYDQNAPGYDQLRTNLMNDAVKNVGKGFIGSGRFGGKSYINDATTAAVNSVLPMDYANYDKSIQNQYNSLAGQMGAAQTGFGMGQQQIANMLSGLAGEMGGAGQNFGMNQQGFANQQTLNNGLASLYNSLILPGLTQAQVGSSQDAANSGNLQGQYDLWQSQYGANTNLLAQLSSILAGNASAAGTTTTNTQPETPWWQTLLGTGLGIAGAFL